MKQKATGVLEVWEPWWTYRKPFAVEGIVEVGAETVEYNMNRFGQEHTTTDS